MRKIASLIVEPYIIDDKRQSASVRRIKRYTLDSRSYCVAAFPMSTLPHFVRTTLEMWKNAVVAAGQVN